MSRISNLVSIRKRLNNTWHSDWYDSNYYNVLLYDDIKTRHYISSIFRRLETPTSHFYIKRDSNLNFFFFSDIFILDHINNSNYRWLFHEVEKFDYFLFIGYYSVYSYYFLKLKMFGLRSKISIGFNSDSSFPYRIQYKSHKLHKGDDLSKLFVFSIFHQKKNKVLLYKENEIPINSYINLYKENQLEFLDKLFSFFFLNVNREERYNSIIGWNQGWFHKNHYLLNHYNNMLFFFFSYLLNKKILSGGFMISFFDKLYFNSCNFINSFYNYSLYSNVNRSKIDRNFYSTFSIFESKKFFFNSLPTSFLYIKSTKNVVKKFFFSIQYIKMLAMFSYVFHKNIYLNKYFFFIKFFYLKTNLLFKNDFYSKKKSFFSSDWFNLKRMFYGHKKFLTKISNFHQLQFKFLDKTYRKQFIREYFTIFFKELEKTVHYYLTHSKKNVHHVYFFSNLFFKYKNYYVPIKDAKIVADYIQLKLHKQLSINRIFYEIREWQFKNYYNRRYLYEENDKFLNFYGEKHCPVLGLRIECSGSYKPGSRKRKKYYGEIVKEVELINKSPNNSFYADLDYYQSSSRLKSGSIGIKVWVFFKTHIYNKNKHFVSIVTSD